MDMRFSASSRINMALSGLLIQSRQNVRCNGFVMVDTSEKKSDSFNLQLLLAR